MSKVFFVGPLPPPVHGFSVINGHMLAGLHGAAAEVQAFDLAPRSLLSPLFMWLAFLAAMIKVRPGKACTLYLPISGGIRQLVDLAFAMPAMWLGFRVFVHHHSFAYLNAKPWFSRMAFLVLRKATHIVLCPAMGQQLSQQYGISDSQVRVLSNAAFLDIEATSDTGGPLELTPLTLGFLSNITAEKGIFSFFDALDALRAKGIPFTALVAGPVSPEVRAQFDERLARSAGVVHLGAVYGAAKEQFFGKTDILLFPTLYANEAEPVTLWEAMAHSVPIIALQRGCIQGIVPSDAGRVVFAPSDFSNVVVEEVVAMNAATGLLASRRAAARAAFDKARLESQANLHALLDEMTASLIESTQR